MRQESSLRDFIFQMTVDTDVTFIVRHTIKTSYYMYILK